MADSRIILPSRAKRPARLVCRPPVTNLSEPEIRAIDHFWSQFSMFYYHIRDGIFKHGKAVLMLTSINSLLEGLAGHVEICLTYGEKNRQAIEPYGKLLELYVSPRLSWCNVPLADALVFRAPDLPNLSVARYRPYHPQDALVKELGYDSEKHITLDDLHFQVIHGYRPAAAHYARPHDLPPNKNIYYPVIHLAIYITDRVASWLLKEEEIRFVGQRQDLITAMTGADGKPIDTRRKVLVEHGQFSGCIFTFLTAALGEHHIINHLGNIELLPLSQAEAPDNLVNIEAVKEELTLLLATYDYHQCAYCGIHELQQELRCCSACRAAYYCSKTCQKANHPAHRLLCKKKLEERVSDYFESFDAPDVTPMADDLSFEALAEQCIMHKPASTSKADCSANETSANETSTDITDAN